MSKTKDEVKLHNPLTLIVFLHGLGGEIGTKGKRKKAFSHLPLDHNGDRKQVVRGVVSQFGSRLVQQGARGLTLSSS